MVHTEPANQGLTTSEDMTDTASASASNSSWPAHDREAQLLAEVLRSSRLALLFGEADSGKTALLKLELMPLLRRRASDRITPAPATARKTGVVVPFPDRRARIAARATRCQREIIVYCDDWTDTPLAALHACIHRAAGTRPAEPTVQPAGLGETLSALSRRLDATIIILLDRFEEFLRSPAHRDESVRFTNELIDAINQPGLPANFLISVDEAARPRLAALRERIPGFDDFSLKLASPQDGKAVVVMAVPTVLKPALPSKIGLDDLPVLNESVRVPDVRPAPAAKLAPTRPASRTKRPVTVKVQTPRVPLKTGDVYAFIETTLARTAAVAAAAAAPTGSTTLPLAQERAEGSCAATAAAAVPSREPLGGEPPPQAQSARPKSVFGWVTRRLRRMAGRVG